MYEYKCRIVKIIDGDTVDVDIDLGFDVWLSKQRVRLYGVDTPKSRTQDKEEKKYGLRAKAFVEHHLPLESSQVLRTKIDKSQGKFGRILGEFVVNDTTINSLLVKTHNAVADHGQSNEAIKAAHRKNWELMDG